MAQSDSTHSREAAQALRLSVSAPLRKIFPSAAPLREVLAISAALREIRSRRECRPPFSLRLA